MNRVVTLHTNGNGNEGNNLEAQVRVLDTRISVLQGEVSQLSRLVAYNLVKKES
jgi:hypothetical protein